jgi:SecD/SecF fusion protein
MKRNFLFRLIVCLVPTLIATFFVARAFVREADGNAGFRRGIDLAGGTILVYEVNLEKARRAAVGTGEDAVVNPAAGLSGDEIRKLAANLKRRIDPADLRNVIVRPVGTSRIEIILPRSASLSGSKEGATEDYIQEVKGLVRQVGVLEFRIVANPNDDAAGVADARSLIERAKTDPKFKDELEDLARRGLPPPAPSSTYSVTVNGETIPDTTYQWVELGPEERESYGLSNAYATEGPKPRPGEKNTPTWLYPAFEAARVAEGGAYAKAGVIVDAGGGSLFFTRDFTKKTPATNEEGKKVEYFVLTRVSPSDAVKVDRDFGLKASSGSRGLEPAVEFNFNSYGASKFGKISERNRKGENGFKRQLAVIMDDKIVSAPTLDAVIRASGTISGSSFDQGSVNRLVNILRSGALNAELKPDPVSENSVGPTLGEDTIRKGLWSVGLAFLAVMAFMVVYYQFAGLVACVALLINLLLTIGFMVAVQAAFTLPGLAGVVLMLGMAVDANVLIYERIREERAKGANLVTAIRLGYDRAFATIIDTHLTSIFTCLVLYAFGNDNLKGFSVSLTVGLLISLFTALYMTRLLFNYATHRRWITDLKMFQLFKRPNFHYMGIRKPVFTASVIATLVGLGLFLARGNSVLNVDFTKGTVYGGRLAEGQARALSDKDNAGLLSLLGEQAQRDKLQVKSVAPAAGDTVEGKTINENVYAITYVDGETVVVTFVNSPDGADTTSQLEDVKRRASELPGLSVEQVFIGGESFGQNKSRSFTVRTTEKEPELVQVMLDRLLRDEKTGDPLLARTQVTANEVAGPIATLTLDRPASPRYFSSFLERELKLVNRWPLVGGLAGLTVTGIPTGDEAQATEQVRSGQFTKLRVDVSTNSEFAALKAAADAGTVATDKKASDELAAFRGALDKAAAAFTARPIPDRLETFDPALASETRNKAFYAILASWLAIAVYLWFRFGNWTFGLAAVLCLVHDVCLTLGAIAVCHYLFDNPFGQILQLHDFKIDLTAIAAILTLVGFSVNDTIVVFDRIREIRGKNPLLTPDMINESVNQTLSRTVLSSLTVFLVVGVLYFFGGEGVHLFSFIMVFGVIVGTYSSIYIASPLLLFFGEGKPKVDPRFPNRALATAGPLATR